MRLFRPVSILVALLLACGLGLVATAPAHAKEPHNVRYVQADEIRNTGTFYFKGAVKTYRGKVVKLQRTRKGSNNWRTIKRDRTNRKGKFYFRFDGPIGTCYRVVIPRTRNYEQYTSGRGCITRG
jgi:hypothetical protein